MLLLLHKPQKAVGRNILGIALIYEQSYLHARTFEKR